MASPSTVAAARILGSVLQHKILNEEMKEAGDRWSAASPSPEEEPRATEEVQAAWKSLHLTDNVASRIEPMSLPTMIGAFGGVALESSNVGVYVDTCLERPQDINKPHRCLKARAIGEIIKANLRDAGFNASLCGSEPALEAILHVRVAVSSEGSYLARMYDPLCRAGHTKLCLLWCLQSVRTRKVAAGGRLFSHKRGLFTWDMEDPDGLLMKSVRKFSREIAHKVSSCVVECAANGTKPTRQPTPSQQREVTPGKIVATTTTTYPDGTKEVTYTKDYSPVLPDLPDQEKASTETEEEEPAEDFPQKPQKDTDGGAEKQQDAPTIYFPDNQDKMTKNKKNKKEFESIIDGLLRNDRKFKVLDMTGVMGGKVGDAGAIHLARALEKNTCVETLDLSYNSIGDEGAAHIARALYKNATLKRVDLSSNKISDEGARHLGGAIARNSSLVQLYLGYNKIGDVGASELAGGLSSNSTLQSLRLRNNDIGIDGLKSILDALAMNDTVKNLPLDANEPVGREEKAILKDIKNKLKRNK